MDKENPWFRFAIEDYMAIQNLKDKNLPRIVLFHAQQFFEKTFKGLLFEKGMKIPKTHDLDFLWKKTGIPLSIFDLTESEIHFLTSIYIETRYPPDLGLLPGGEPSKEDEQEAVRLVEKLYQKVKEQMN